MSDKETKILKTFAMIIPKLSERDKSYLLGLGEGMAIKIEEKEEMGELISCQEYCPQYAE